MPQPNKPVAQPVRVDKAKTVVLVLDLGARCEHSSDPCSKLLPAVSSFLEKARKAGVPILFTTSLMHQGTPLGEVAAPLGRLSKEAVIQPDGFDKFTGGALQEFLTAHKAENLVVVGSATNVAVMYTVTTAARVHRYQVVIPLDGVNSYGEYEHEYALHQLSTLPSPPARAIQFTSFPLLEIT